MIRHGVETCMTAIFVLCKTKCNFLITIYTIFIVVVVMHLEIMDLIKHFNSGNMMASRGFWWYVRFMVSICGSSSPFYFDVDPFWNPRKSPFFCQMSRRKRQPEAFNNWKYSKPTHLEMGGRWIKLHEPSPVPLEHLECEHFLASNVFKKYVPNGVVETNSLNCPWCFRVLIPVDFQSKPHWNPLNLWKENKIPGAHLSRMAAPLPTPGPGVTRIENTCGIREKSRERAANRKDYASCHMHKLVSLPDTYCIIMTVYLSFSCAASFLGRLMAWIFNELRRSKWNYSSWNDILTVKYGFF